MENIHCLVIIIYLYGSSLKSHSLSLKTGEIILIQNIEYFLANAYFRSYEKPGKILEGITVIMQTSGSLNDKIFLSELYKLIDLCHHFSP